MGSDRFLRWGFPLLAGLALIGSSVACGAGQFRLRSAGAEPVDQEQVVTEEAAATSGPAPSPTLEPSPTAEPTLAPSPTPVPVKLAVVQAKALRVRKGAGTGHPVIGGVKQGQELEILGQNADGSWLNVRVGDKEGWVAAEFVKVVQATPAPGAQAGQVPATSNASKASGLGIARNDVQAFYEDLGFIFEKSGTIDGLERLAGTNHTKQATVTLVGPEANLHSAAITAVTRYDQETMVLSAAYLTGFVARVLPAWTDGPGWVQANISGAKRGTPANTTTRNVGAKLSGDETVLTLELTGQ